MPVEYSDGIRANVEKSTYFNNELENVAKAEMQLKLVTSYNKKENAEGDGQKALKKGILPYTDAVLKTTILNWQERIGSGVGATQGAVVSFVMKLIKTSDNRELWNATFHFRDQALTEDLLQVGKHLGKGNTRWHVAGDLYKKGLALAFQDLSMRREKVFTNN